MMLGIPIPVPPPLLCTVMGCDIPVGGEKWAQVQWVAAVVLVLLAFILLWADFDTRSHDE